MTRYALLILFGRIIRVDDKTIRAGNESGRYRVTGGNQTLRLTRYHGIRDVNEIMGLG
jgi:hypothetical protein